MPEFRRMRPDGLAAFCDRSEDPARLREQLAAFLAAGSVQPGWCWIAVGSGGATLARHFWWGPPGSGAPRIFNSVSAEDPSAALSLLEHARDRLAVTNARSEVIVPRDQGDDPSAVKADLVALLTGAGFAFEISRVRVQWTRGAAALAGDSGRLSMRPAREIADDALVALFRAVADGSLDHGMTAGRARLGAEAEARERLGFVRSFPAGPDWFTVGVTPAGELAGYVAPGLAGTMPVVAEIGVAAAHRGQGFVNDLLAYATRVLTAEGANQIRADTDRANTPMRAAFARAGYREFAWRDDYTWRKQVFARTPTGSGTNGPPALTLPAPVPTAVAPPAPPPHHSTAGPGTTRAAAAKGQTVQLATPRLRLVPLTVSDADEMAVVLADPRIYEFIGGAPPSAGELRSRYGRLAAGHSPDGSQVWHNWTVQTLTGTTVGTAQTTVVDDGTRAEVAWVMGQPHWGQGYASEAAAAVVGWLGHTGVREVIAHIHPGHVASQTVARRAGLHPTDVFKDGEQRWVRRF